VYKPESPDAGERSVRQRCRTPCKNRTKETLPGGGIAGEGAQRQQAGGLGALSRVAAKLHRRAIQPAARLVVLGVEALGALRSRTGWSEFTLRRMVVLAPGCTDDEPAAPHTWGAAAAAGSQRCTALPSRQRTCHRGRRNLSSIARERLLQAAMQKAKGGVQAAPGSRGWRTAPPGAAAPPPPPAHKHCFYVIISNGDIGKPARELTAQ